MVAMPLCASVEATAKGAPCLLSVNPWPKIATGQPLVGRGPDGMNRLKKISSDPCQGTLCVVGTCGMKTLPFCQCCPVNLPKARVPTEPGKTCRAGVGTGTVIRGPVVRVCWPQSMPIIELTGNTVFSPCVPRLKL